MKLGKNGKHRGKSTLKTVCSLCIVSGASNRLQHFVCQVDFNAVTEPSITETTVKSNGPMTFYRHCIWLKVTKTSPVANIVSFVYKMSGMALLGI